MFHFQSFQISLFRHLSLCVHVHFVKRYGWMNEYLYIAHKKLPHKNLRVHSAMGGCVCTPSHSTRSLQRLLLAKKVWLSVFLLWRFEVRVGHCLYVCMHAGGCVIGLLHVFFLTVNKDQDSDLPIIQILCTAECAVVGFYRRVLMMICRYRDSIIQTDFHDMYFVYYCAVEPLAKDDPGNVKKQCGQRSVKSAYWQGGPAYRTVKIRVQQTS